MSQDLLASPLKLAKSSAGRKFIVKGNEKHYIPDSETKNALGLEGGAFILMSDEKLEKLRDGVNIQSVRSPKTRLVRADNSHDDIFIIFSWPELHRRFIPDQATLIAMHRRQSQAEVISNEEMEEIPEKEAINPSSKWDPRIVRSEQQSETYINNYYGPVGTSVGSNRGKLISNQDANTNKTPGKFFQILLAILGASGLLIAAYLSHKFGWK